MDEVIGYRPGKWLNERPRSIQNYVKALCGLKNENCGLKVIKAALVMEIIYSIHNKRIVLPLSFIINMVSTRLTRCKRVSRIIGSLTPSGGYDHLRKWVKSVTDTPLTPR